MKKRSNGFEKLTIEQSKTIDYIHYAEYPLYKRVHIQCDETTHRTLKLQYNYTGYWMDRDFILVLILHILPLCCL